MKRQLTHKNYLILLALCFMTPVLLKAQNIFKNQLPIPPKESIAPNSEFIVDAIETMHNFDPNGYITSDNGVNSPINLNVNIPARAYQKVGSTTPATFLSPTLVVQTEEPIIFDLLNDLMGTNTTCHFNGLNTPPIFGPHNEIAPTEFKIESFTVVDPVKTASYHPILFDGSTLDQVNSGLAGMIIVEDPMNDPLHSSLPHNYGENDFPIIIQDKRFDLDNSTNPSTATDIASTALVGVFYASVNGVVGGNLHVPPEIVRLRILNASTISSYHIGLSTKLNNPTDFADMHMIATGGGYIDTPKVIKKTVIAAGESKEFVLDFSQWADGDTVYMSDLAIPSDFRVQNSVGDALMAFVVDDALFPSNPIVSIPTVLNTSYGLAPGMVSKERTKAIDSEFLIDGNAIDAGVINDTILVDSKERWTITNNSDASIPFAMSKVPFQVVSYNGRVGAGDVVENHTDFNTMPEDLMGYKHVQLLRSGATMAIEMKFDSFPSPAEANQGYLYYSSRLDAPIMNQFVVIDSMDFFTGLASIAGTEELAVFPNPATHSISFEGTFDGKGTLRIFDVMGRILREEEISSLANHSISVADLPRGVVIVEYTSEDKHYLSKVTLH